MAKYLGARPLLSRIKDNLPIIIISVFAIFLFVAIYIKGGNAQIFNTIITGGLWALLAVGLALVFGVMNIPHFAHGESFMIGAYVAYFTFTPMQEYLYEKQIGRASCRERV